MKYRLTLALALMAAACSPSPEKLAERARSAFAAHDFAAARIDLAEALKQRPGDRDLLLLQARTLIELGDGDGAGAAIGKLAGANPPQGELAELAANAALLRRQSDQVFTLLDSAKSVEAFRLRGIAAMQKQDMARARAEFEQAVAAGGSARSFADFARLLMIAGDLPQAEAMQAKAEQTDPGQLGAMLTGGELALQRGDLAKALGYYDRAAKAYPDNFAALTGRASVLGDLGRFDQMEPQVAALAAAHPKDTTVAFLQARLAKARSNWQAVRDIVQPLEAQLNQQDPVRLIYAEALSQTGQAQQAIAQSAPIARANPGNREALRILATAQLAGGDAKAALATYRPVAVSPAVRPEELALFRKISDAAGQPLPPQAAPAELGQKMKSVLADLSEGDAAIRQGNWARAATAYDRILAVTDRRNVLVLNNAAYAKSMLGEHAKAVELASQALALAPDNPAVLDTAGWVLFRSGKDLAKARSLSERAAKLAPNNRTIRDHLAEIQRKAS